MCRAYLCSQVLDTLHYSYDTLSSKDERAIDLACIVAFAASLKLVYIIGVHVTTKATAKLKPPAAKRSTTRVASSSTI